MALTTAMPASKIGYLKMRLIDCTHEVRMKLAMLQKFALDNFGLIERQKDARQALGYLVLRLIYSLLSVLVLLWLK